MKKPETRFSNGKKWKIYLESYYLQILAKIITLFTGREITHVFWYSKMQDKVAKDLLFPARPKSVALFKGKYYTEMSNIMHGFSNWSDAKIIGFGSIKDVAFVDPYTYWPTSRIEKLKDNLKEYIAIILYKLGFKPGATTFIDEDTIMMGYGKCHGVGVFEYPLPKKYVKKIMGCTTWIEHEKKFY